ncbi:hypothetical protein AKJ51_03320 [candidate division MSBL1 archaeon SCGC-AAA382A20]|uniref:Amidohydrolase-related domain-containing protein n=1 Tax=candidate division MSBL1 archaeon SCGC-AAA382A20 TaxID=1698280 RepID=A0A133VJN8_9EURY|nr:hypothetical protein AKJ51_03320 [candidate division MSBL1 archaeon SCGC-AAA382A20]
MGATMSIIIENGLIVTMDRDNRIIKGSVSIKDSEIVEIGEVEKGDFDKVIEAEGKIVMPGLVCAYTRPYKVLLKGASLKIEPPSDFTQILQRIWWPMDENLSNEDTYSATLATCVEFIKSGITFFGGSHSSQGSIGKSLDDVASAVEKSGLRAYIGFEASERNTHAEGARGMRENIRFLEKRNKKCLKEPRVRGMVCLSASFTSSDELLGHGKRVANRFDVPTVISAAEGAVDPYHNLKKFGKRTIERFRDVGFLSSNTVLSHCVHVNEDELSIIKKTGAKVAHSPMGDMLNALGVSPVLEMRDMGIPVGLGVDGSSYDGFENIRSFYLLHKLLKRDPRVISSFEALKMATIEGAKLYGVENKIGSIEPGKRADVIVLNPSRVPTPINQGNVLNHIVNTVLGNDVETVIVDGDIIMENRNIKTLDEKRAIERSKETAKKVWKDLNLQRGENY